MTPLEEVPVDDRIQTLRGTVADQRPAVPFWPGEPDALEELTLTDGATIHVEVFERPDGGNRRVLLFLHGIGSYAAPYRKLATGVLSVADAVVMPDLRGHGRSGHPRGFMGTPARVLGDIAEMVAHLRERWPGYEVVLGGESMGGLMALAYAAQGREPIDRLLLLAPALKLHAASTTCATITESLRDFGRGFRIHGDPSGVLPPEPRFGDRTRADPLMLPRAGVGYMATIGLMMTGWASRYSHRVKVPTLVVQGTLDRVVDARAAMKLARMLPSVTLRLVPGAWHNLLWDAATGETIDAIADWLGAG
jgi:acylglycerol lipase